MRTEKSISVAIRAALWYTEALACPYRLLSALSAAIDPYRPYRHYRHLSAISARSAPISSIGPIGPVVPHTPTRIPFFLSHTSCPLSPLQVKISDTVLYLSAYISVSNLQHQRASPSLLLSTMAGAEMTRSATEQPIFATLGIATATEHSVPPAPAVQVLLRTEDIEQLCEAERSFAPRRSLQLIARKALEVITKAGPNSSMDSNLEHLFPWRSYVACHEDAHAIIGSGIALAMAEFIEGTKDPNRGGQPRLDFVLHRTDGTYCCLHPGSKKRGDAKPIFLPSPARDLATEHISTRNDLSSLPASPYTCEHASLVPQIDRMGKADAFRSLQLAPCGPPMQ